MRNLVLILIAFIAVVTFIRAFDTPERENFRELSPAVVEFNANN